MTKKIEESTPLITPERCFDAVRSAASDNFLFFKNDSSDIGQKMSEYLSTIIEGAENVVPLMEEIESKSHFYQFSEEVKSSGYTSWIKFAGIIASRTLKLLGEVAGSRSSYFFRKDYYLKEVKAYSEAFDSLCVMMTYLLAMMSLTESSRDLILYNGKHTLEEMMTKHHKYFNQYCFYGRCLCFQFCDSMAAILKALNILMASFSEVYYSDGQIIDPLLRGSKYWVDQESRAKRVVNISQYASASFCKNYWFLGEIEIMQRIPDIMLPSIQVNKVIMLDPKPLVIENIYGKNVDIPIPSSHIGHAPISLRLLSSSLRLGMDAETSSRSGYKYPSDTLVFHCHGGGFVAQSSRSHENYLRQWAIDLDTPFLSVDYALAPEAPYPRAIEEVFYAYCWALSNASLLGTSAEKIIVAGDSAGGNINIALTMMCLEYGIKKPNGLFLAYVPMILSLDLSPSRMFTLIDPLLPMGLVIGLTKAYVYSPEQYAKCKDHERKLRRNVSNLTEGSKSESPAENGHANEKQEEDKPSIERGEEASKPALMNRKHSSGIISRWVSSLSTKLALLSPSRSFTDEDELEKEMEEERHVPVPFDMIHEFNQDPYFSPYFASDSILMNFPSVALMTTDTDPFLDDCIMFGQKLKRLGVPVTLDIVPGLCHGFLNFSLLSSEANEGSKLCVKRISELISSIDPVNDASTAADAEECL